MGQLVYILYTAVFKLSFDYPTGYGQIERVYAAHKGLTVILPIIYNY